MRNLTICILAIGLSFVAVDGVWALEDADASELERLERGGEDTTKDTPDHPDYVSSGLIIFTQTGLKKAGSPEDEKKSEKEGSKE